MIWLVLGSGPSAPVGLEIALIDGPDVTITTNYSMSLLPNPTYYFVTDHRACRELQAEARRAKMRGTRLLSLKRTPAVLKERRIEWFDEFIREGHPYEPFNMSGVWCLEYACRNGASVVHLVGLEGYGPTGSHYFNGRETRLNNYQLTVNVIGPRMNTLIGKYPDVQFICHGQPNYQMQEAENWTISNL